MAAEPLSTPLSIAINNSFKYNIFPSNAKVACVKLLDKKTEDKYCISNFRLVTILNNLSKIYENFAKNILVSNTEEFFSSFLAAYRKSCSTQHVLIIMLEEWKENLDNNFIVGTVLTDLSKDFDCITHDLLIAKLSAYGLNSDSLCYIYYFLKKRKQCVQINSEYCKVSLTQSYQVYPKAQFSDQFFFFNHFFFLIPKASVHNFADDNTLASFACTLKELLSILESECEAAINWRHKNKMIVNPDKFQIIILDKRGSDNNNIEVKAGNKNRLSFSESMLTIN